MVVRELVTLLGFKLEDGPQKQYNSQLDQTKERSNSLANAARGIGTAYKIAAAATAVAVGWISKNIISATVEYEAYRMQMETFTGSAEAAAQALDDLRDKKIDALFGTGVLVSAHNQLRLLGMGAEDTSRMIDILGDIANGSAANFNKLSNTMGRIAAAGKVTERDLRLLINAGFGMYDMAQGLGISVEQLNARIAAGAVSFDDLKLAMHGATQEGGRFYRNAERQANTLGGSLKILHSTIGNIKDAIGSGVVPQLVSLIRYLTNLVSLGHNGLVNFGQRAFDHLIHVIFQVIIFFEVLQMRMRRFGGAFTPLKAIFKDFFDFFNSVAASVRPVLISLAMLMLVAFRPIQAFVRPVLEGLKPVIRNVFGFLALILAGLVPIVYGLTPLFEILGRLIGGLGGPILGIAVALFAVNKAFAFGKGIMAAYKKMLIGIKIVKMLLSGNIHKMRAATMLLAGSSKISAGAVKVLSGAHAVLAGKMTLVAAAKKILTAAQLKLNAVMKANKIGLIIMAIVALISGIGLLVRNWDRIVPAVKNAFGAIGNFFGSLGSAIAGFFSNLWDSVVNVFPNITAFVRDNLVNIVHVIVTILFPIAGIVMALVRIIINNWEEVKEAASQVWEAVKNFVIGAVIGIKNAWNGLLNFFRGLWDALRQSPSEALDFIKNAFFGLFNSIKEKFFGFINVIRNGFEKVKGFFGGIGRGVANLFSRSGDEETQRGGRGNTGGAYGGLALAAATSGAGSISTYNTGGYSQTVNAHSQITVNVPAGTSAEQAQAISRQVDQSVNESIGRYIGGARGSIPSPEARRR